MRLVPVSVAVAAAALVGLGASAPIDLAAKPAVNDTVATARQQGYATQPAATSVPSAAVSTGSARAPSPSPETSTQPLASTPAAVVALASTVAGAAFPRALDESPYAASGPEETFDLAKMEWTAAGVMWQDVRKRFGVQYAPRFRPLVYNSTYQEVETTDCPELNGGKPVVTAASVPFFCATDAQGTVYWPVKALEQRWKQFGTLGNEVVLRGFAVWMHQLYGEYMAVQVYRRYTSTSGVPPLSKPKADQLQAVSLCFAGTALQGAFMKWPMLLAGLSVIYPGGQPVDEHVRALKTGFDQNDLGACVAAFWPRTA